MWWHAPVIAALGGWDRRIPSVSSAWATQRVPGKPGLQSEFYLKRKRRRKERRRRMKRNRRRRRKTANKKSGQSHPLLEAMFCVFLLFIALCTLTCASLQWGYRQKLKITKMFSTACLCATSVPGLWNVLIRLIFIKTSWDRYYNCVYFTHEGVFLIYIFFT